jgi:PAS domain S-box-containing protein
MQIRREGEIKCYVHVDALRVKKDDSTLNFRMTFTDISKTKLMEQDLRIAASAFEVQEALVITDKQSKIIRVNQAFVKLTDYCADDVIGHNGTFITEKSQYPESFKSIIDRVSPLKCWQGEVWSRRRDGVVFPCLASVTAVLDNEGHTTHYVGFFSDITLQKQAEKILLEDKQRLETKIEKTATELTSVKTEYEDANTALKVLIRMRNTENVTAKSLLNDELSSEILPFLEKLKQGYQDVRQVRLVNTLEANLQHLVNAYGVPTSISSSYKNLTPKEIQVATMVREGFSTKAIASALSLSPETISIHRKNIRRKIGLDSKDKNLRSHLMISDNT